MMATRVPLTEINPDVFLEEERRNVLDARLESGEIGIEEHTAQRHCSLEERQTAYVEMVGESSKEEHVARLKDKR